MKKRLKTILPISMSAFLLFGTSSCFFMERKIASAELSKGYERTASDSGEVNDTFKTSLADFSFSLFKETVTKNKQNDLVSPLSAALCLALINNGAGGNTRAELETLFGMDTDAFNRAMYAYTSSLYSSDECKLSLANSIWMKENALNVNPAFLQSNADWYGAQVYASPFDSTTITDINNWCYNKTQGKIKKILDEIPSSAVMYLLNAVDFDAKWQKKYELSDVKKQSFYNYDDSEPTVNMLYSKESTYLTDENAIGFTKPYKNNQYSFVALLPDEETDIYDYLDSLNVERWNALWENKITCTVHARMPEFTYESSMSLNETLQALGVHDMFSPENADFSRIDSTQQLCCAMVKQKTFIQVDRNGTKAAAVTLGGMMKMSAEPPKTVYITLDRPFVYAIVENATHLPLFLGAVTNL